MWTISRNSTQVSFASLGLSNLTRARISAEPDTVTATQDGAAFDGSPLWAYVSVRASTSFPGCRGHDRPAA